MALSIQPFSSNQQQQVIELVLHIQQKEFNVPITINDQKDLLDIDSFYKKENGNFWVALDEEKVVGTIALIDIGNDLATLRKMFVHKNYRGKEKQTSQLLLNTLIEWCNEKKIKAIYLGTIDRLIAARKFYEKNGFEEITKSSLPLSFPVMQVDNLFYRRKL